MARPQLAINQKFLGMLVVGVGLAGWGCGGGDKDTTGNESQGAAGASDAEGGAADDTTDSTGSRSPGCGTPISSPDPEVQQTIDVDGTTRYYLLDVPSEADNQEPLMLIFGLHGYDMNNVAVAGLFNFTKRSNGQAITVLPYGEGPPPGDVAHWGDHALESTWTPNETNYAFIQQLITDLEDRFCIDPSRVYIAGFSMGAFFTNTIACDHSDWFRGFASIAGGKPAECAAGVKSAMMIHHGTADDIVDIASGEESRDFWVEQNGCEQTSSASYPGCESYDGCPDATPVVWCPGNYDHTITTATAAKIWMFIDDLK